MLKTHGLVCAAALMLTVGSTTKPVAVTGGGLRQVVGTDRAPGATRGDQNKVDATLPAVWQQRLDAVGMRQAGQRELAVILLLGAS